MILKLFEALKKIGEEVGDKEGLTVDGARAGKIDEKATGFDKDVLDVADYLTMTGEFASITDIYHELVRRGKVKGNRELLARRDVTDKIRSALSAHGRLSKRPGYESVNEADDAHGWLAIGMRVKDTGSDKTGEVIQVSEDEAKIKWSDGRESWLSASHIKRLPDTSEREEDPIQTTSVTDSPTPGADEVDKDKDKDLQDIPDTTKKEGEEEEIIDIEGNKEYLGNNDHDTFFYLVKVPNETEGVKDIQIVDAGGDVLFAASDEGLEVTDVKNFLLKGLQKVEIANLSYDLVLKYLVPEEEEVEAEEEPAPVAGTDKEQPMKQDVQPGMSPIPSTQTQVESVKQFKCDACGKEKELKYLSKSKGNKNFCRSCVTNKKVDENADALYAKAAQEGKSVLTMDKNGYWLSRTKDSLGKPVSEDQAMALVKSGKVIDATQYCTPFGLPNAKIEEEAKEMPDIPGIEDMLVYLDELRVSGETNMFGATPYIENEFGISKRDAREVLVYWMETFSARHPKESVDEAIGYNLELHQLANKANIETMIDMIAKLVPVEQKSGSQYKLLMSHLIQLQRNADKLEQAIKLLDKQGAMEGKVPSDASTNPEGYIGDLMEKFGLTEAKMICVECGAKFNKNITNSTVEVKCPKCGGYDTEVDESFIMELREKFGLVEAKKEPLDPDNQEVADISKKHGFGSVAWQDAMIDRIRRKLANKQPLSGVDTGFIETQKMHNKSVEIEELERMWKLQSPNTDEGKVTEMALAGTKYAVVGQAHDRSTGEMVGKQREEEIDISQNKIFQGVKSIGDIEARYEAFWNDLNKSSSEIVKVISIRPINVDKMTKSGGVAYEGKVPADPSTNPEGYITTLTEKFGLNEGTKIVLKGLLVRNDKEWQQVVDYFVENKLGTIKLIGQFKTLPGKGGSGGRNEVVAEVETDNIGKLAVSPLHLSGDMSWHDDYIDNNKSIIPPEGMQMLGDTYTPTAKTTDIKPAEPRKSNLAVNAYGRGDSVKALAAIRTTAGIQSNVRPDATKYLTYTEGTSNKYHYFALFNTGKEYIAANAYARIGYTPQVDVFARGDIGTVKAAYQKKISDKVSKGYRVAESLTENDDFSWEVKDLLEVIAIREELPPASPMPATEPGAEVAPGDPNLPQGPEATGEEKALPPSTPQEAEAQIRMDYPEEPFTSTALAYADVLIDEPQIFGAIRNLQWEGIYTNGDTFLKQSKVVGKYNNFNTDVATRLVDKFRQSAKYRLARDNSVAVFLTIIDSSTQVSLEGLKALANADKVEQTGKPGEAKLWWN